MMQEEELFWAAIDRSLAPETKQVSREQLRSRVGKALTNAMNYPRAVRPHILGRDLSGLIDSVIDALLASDLFAIPVDADTYRNPYQAETLQGLRESGNGEMHDLGSFAEPATEPWTDPTPWLHDHPAEWCRENGKRYRDPGGVGNIYAPRSRAEYDAEEGKR